MMVRLSLTADRREIKDFPKLHWATPFIRKTLSGILIADSQGIYKKPLGWVVPPGGHRSFNQPVRPHSIF